jgi:hypothetical protein
MMDEHEDGVEWVKTWMPRQQRLPDQRDET